MNICRLCWELIWPHTYMCGHGTENGIVLPRLLPIRKCSEHQCRNNLTCSPVQTSGDVKHPKQIRSCSARDEASSATPSDALVEQ